MVDSYGKLVDTVYIPYPWIRHGTYLAQLVRMEGNDVRSLGVSMKSLHDRERSDLEHFQVSKQNGHRNLSNSWVFLKLQMMVV